MRSEVVVILAPLPPTGIVGVGSHELVHGHGFRRGGEPHPIHPGRACSSLDARHAALQSHRHPRVVPRHSVVFIPDAKVQGQVAGHLPVVLEERAELATADVGDVLVFTAIDVVPAVIAAVLHNVEVLTDVRDRSRQEVQQVDRVGRLIGIPIRR